MPGCACPRRTRRCYGQPGGIWGRWPGGTWPPGAREGRLDARGRAVSRARRKRAMTAESSSRWAGAITRTSEDQYRLAVQNLRAERATLQVRIRRIRRRLLVPTSRKVGRTPRVRHPSRAARQARPAPCTSSQARRSRPAAGGPGAVSVVRGGKALLRKRSSLAAAGLTKEGWQREWESARLFLTANGEKDKAWGNETIRWNPVAGWLEIKLPARSPAWPTSPTAATACPARSGSPTAATRSPRRPPPVPSATTSATTPCGDTGTSTRRGRPVPAPAPSLDQEPAAPVLAVDLNNGHLAAWAVTPDGNPAGPPVTIPVDLAGLPASQRSGRLRAAIGSLTRLARLRGCAGDRDRGP